MSQLFQFYTPTVADPKETNSAAATAALVLSIECLRGSSTAGEWTGHLLQTGDIVEELAINGDSAPIKSPFKKGSAGVQKILRKAYKNNDTSVIVRVRRGTAEFAELQACIVPEESSQSGKSKKKNKQYVLRAIGDPNYAFGFSDRTESECLRLQASRNTRIVDEVHSSSLEDGYVSYDWGKKMQEMLLVPNSSCFLSILFLPIASDQVASLYNDLEDTLARTNAWLNASQNSGVPIVFMNIQTESLLTKISGEMASSRVAGSLSELCNVASSSLYGFEDYHGVDIGVVRAVRLWYAPAGGEFSFEIKIKDGDTKLGFSLSRTDEGFIYISSVDEGDGNTPAIRSGLDHLYKDARRSSHFLVVSRISNQKVLPWLVSSVGAIKCFDTFSLSHKLSLHRRAKVPILLHLFSWDSVIFTSPRGGSPSPSFRINTLPEISLVGDTNHSQIHHQPELVLGGDEAGDVSLRFHDIKISDEWLRK